MTPRPKFKTLKRTVSKDHQLIRRQTWTAPDAVQADAVHAAITGSATLTVTTTTAITSPDFARQLIVTTGGTTGDVKASSITMTGTDIDGNVITDTFVLTENLNGTKLTTKAFKTVTSIAIPAQDGAGATFTFGITDKLGLAEAIDEDSVLHTLFGGTVEATRPTVTATTLDKTKCLLDLNTALNATGDVVCYFAYPFPST